MPRTTKPLSDTECRNARPREKDYSLFDGNGLHLLVKKNGTRSWRFKFTKPDGKAGLMAFGDYPILSLTEARAKHAAARNLLAKGIDPVVHKQQLRNDITRKQANSFEAVAREWHAKNAGKWSSDHASRILTRLEADVFPSIGHCPVAELKTRDLLVPLRIIEQRDALDLAGRVRQHINGIMRYAVQTGLIDSNPAADLTGALSVRKGKHHPALPLQDIPDFLRRLHGYKGRLLTVLAVRLTLLTFVHSSELRFMRWDELDMDRAIWTIPASRDPIEGVKYSHRGAKMRESHIVPLSRQALAVIEAIRPLTGRFDLVFAGDHDVSKPMSENTVNAVLRRLGYNTKVELCGHGFRAMACSALLESGQWSKDAIERQMSHKERNGVRAAYIHLAEFIAQRQQMVQWWADWLDSCKNHYVPPHEFSGMESNVIHLPNSLSA
ncbi:integrase arm-type DNA-binding domain-containing protein [Aeromonas caviae]|uniref:tyrosine-type recombinase/integrase n=1 Tax=Aeromonas caviae TaxID=648 RepID=UPI001BD40469|nr:integrase arm-type DNA-binding domain-containing protein [Aeromonas caviae]MBS4721137.1 integrase arm-type DNA-binding domain-containing protein [Aeromonas caviae]